MNLDRNVLHINKFSGKTNSRDLGRFLDDLRHASDVHLDWLMEIILALRFSQRGQCAEYREELVKTM